MKMGSCISIVRLDLKSRDVSLSCFSLLPSGLHPAMQQKDRHVHWGAASYNLWQYWGYLSIPENVSERPGAEVQQGPSSPQWDWLLLRKACELSTDYKTSSSNRNWHRFSSLSWFMQSFCQSLLHSCFKVFPLLCFVWSKQISRSTQSTATTIPMPAASSPSSWRSASMCSSLRPADCSRGWSTFLWMASSSLQFRRSASTHCSWPSYSSTPTPSIG